MLNSKIIGKFVRAESGVNLESLAKLKNSLKLPSLKEVDEASAILKDPVKSIGLSDETIQKFCKKIADGYSKDRFIPAGKNTEKHFEFCKITDKKSKEILEDGGLQALKATEDTPARSQKERLIGIMKATPCLSYLDNEPIVALAKSISALG